VRNDTGRRLGPGLDVRADGGYVIAPPSRHASGRVYRWAGEAAELPQLPGWLLAMLRPPPRPPRVTAPMAPTSRLRAWGRAALDGELAQLRAAPSGTRNAALNRAAFCLGQVAAGGGLDDEQVTALLVGTAVAIGLGEREAVTTVRSGLDAGRNVPRYPGASRSESMR
jgi:hypothetical protein